MKALAILWKLEVVIAGTFLVLMVLLIFSGGVARMLHHPLNWTGDAATCLFAWACFLCADNAWRKNSLMSIELVTRRLPERAQKALAYLSHLIVMAFLIYVMIAGVYLSWISRTRSFQGIPEISYSWVTMSMPVGAALLMITAILKMREELLRGAGSPAGPVTPMPT
jgi:TRAP-type C4-dicarboxylate transport system permease small subunit